MFVLPELLAPYIPMLLRIFLPSNSNELENNLLILASALKDKTESLKKR